MRALSDICRRLTVLAAILGGSAILAWTSLGRWALPEVGPRQPDYFNLLVSGFQKGSLALDIEVPESLRGKADLRDPSKRPPDVDVPHDVSFKDGHYYLYFGVVPSVLLFWPFRVLTGHDLPLVLGSLAFGIGAYLVTAALWLKIVHDKFPRAGLATRVAGIAALCLAGGQWVLARRISIWEPSIIAGNFFLVCMLASGYRALHASRNPTGWLAISGLCLGLAVGSRPSLMAAGPGLGCLVIAVGCARGNDGRRPRLGCTAKAAVEAGLPLTVVVAALLAYNWARFGSPFEFGLNYQLTSTLHARHFSLSYIPYNIYAYFSSAPQWGRYFPFVHPIAQGAMPSGYYGKEFVYGALVICPVIWWVLLAPLATRHADQNLRSFMAMLACVGFCETFVLLSFDTAAARYETDFLPWWVWLGTLSCGILEDRLRSLGRTGLARVLQSAFCASAAFSCFLAFCVSCELHDILRIQNPGAYRALSRAFNIPAAIFEHMTGFKGGAVTMNVSFARHPSGSYEPLVVTGVEYQKDYLYLFYQSDRVVKFCYQHPGEPLASSADVPFEPGRTYPVRVEFPSLYPPEGYCAFDGWEHPEIESLKHWVKVDFNGQTVLIDSRTSNEASPGSLQIGRDRDGTCGALFSGRISDVRRAGWARPEVDLTPPGEYEISIALPQAALPYTQPLLTAGRSGKADLVGLRMDDHAHYRFTYESWGKGLWLGESLPVPPDRLISARIRMGAALGLDPSSPLGILARSVVVWKDGVPVCWHHTGYPLDPSPQVRLVSNAIGSSIMAPEFQGRLVAANRSPRVFAWRTGPFTSLEMDLGGRGQGTEPVLATGVRGRADLLAIEWLPNSSARLLYDHWGLVPISSDAFEWKDSPIHRVQLEMPSLPALDSGHGSVGDAGPLKVSVDGEVVWAANVPFFCAASDSVSLCQNSSGFSTAATELSCAVIGLRQDIPLKAETR